MQQLNSGPNRLGDGQTWSEYSSASRGMDRWVNGPVSPNSMVSRPRRNLAVNIDRLSNEEGCAQQVEQELSRLDLGRYKPLWTE